QHHPEAPQREHRGLGLAQRRQMVPDGGEPLVETSLAKHHFPPCGCGASHTPQYAVRRAINHLPFKKPSLVSRRPPPPRPDVCKGVLWPSGKTGPSASGKMRGFGAACPMARTCAYLRIAEAISGPVARLATGPGGLTLGRAGFAPAGRCTKFHEGITTSNPL